MKRNWWTILIPALLLLCCAARAESAKYYYMVSVTDLSSDSVFYDSCENTHGDLMISTQRQDGSIGPTWEAGVATHEWDREDGTVWYTLNCENGTRTRPTELDESCAIDGFPVKLWTLGSTSWTAENARYGIGNLNSTYTSKLRFTIWISTNGKNFRELQSWEGTVPAGGDVDFDMYVDESLSPYPVEIVDFTGPTEVDIPRNGQSASRVRFYATMRDQYGAPWYAPNASVKYSLSEEPEGVSIDSDGVLTVSPEAAEVNGGPRISLTVSVIRRMDAILHPEKKKTLEVELFYPEYLLTYYNCGKAVAAYNVYYGTVWNHPDDIPKGKTRDAQNHYVFTGWDPPGGTTVEGDMSFTAGYRAESHTFAINPSLQYVSCTSCGYHQRRVVPGDFLAGTGTAGDPYLVRSAEDWNDLSQYIQVGGETSGIYFRLDSDIAITSMLGSFDRSRPFSGVFDGGGHTIQLSGLTSSESYTSPFAFISGAVIKNLKVTGIMNGSTTSRVSGLAGMADGAVIENCWVSASMTRFEAGYLCSGFLSMVRGTVEITGCLYSGSFMTSEADMGVFWGYKDHAAVIRIRNSIDASPSDYTSGAGNMAPGSTADHFYCLVRGKPEITWMLEAHTISTAENVTADPGEAEAVYNVSGITAYSGGLFYNNAFYAGRWETVGLSLEAEGCPAGFLTEYYTDEGMVTQTENGYELLMEDSDLTIRVRFLNPLSALAGEGTRESPWELAESAHWDLLAQSVGNGLDTAGTYLRLASDITAAAMAGTQANPFSGSLDGAGHTLTVSLSSADAFVAPFPYVKGASFSGLRLEGTIEANGGSGAGLVGRALGDCAIVDCLSAVTITGTAGGGHAGFAVNCAGGTVSVAGSAFTGSISDPDAAFCTGFLGWYGSTADDCVYDGAMSAGGNSNNFIRTRDYAVNCYYLNADGVDRVKGARGYPVTGAYGTVLDPGTPTAVYPVSGITAYPTGLVYNGVLYAGEGDTVTLRISADPPEGMVPAGAEADAGTLTESGDAWTLTMPGSGVTISMNWLPAFGTPDFTLPAFLTAVEEEAFEGIGARVVMVPDGCTAIGSRAFRGCAALARIRVPAGCSLGEDVFDGCTLVYVYSAPGSAAEEYCAAYGNCVFVPAE